MKSFGDVSSVALVIAGEDSSPNKSSRLSPTQSKYVWLNDYTTLTYLHPTFAPIDDKNGSLWANLINLKHFLPKPLQGRFINEINECKIGQNPKFENQTEWKLVDALIVDITD